MKLAISLVLVLLGSELSRAQTLGSGGVEISKLGLAITFESRLEPSKPSRQIDDMSGVMSLDQGRAGMRRYSANHKTHKYSGYDLTVSRGNQAGSYQVTFSALTATPAELHLPDPELWHLAAPPTFPPPQISSLSDTIAVTAFEDPTTNQKMVDYISLKRTDCLAADPDSAQIPCLAGLLRDARRSLTNKLNQLESGPNPAPASAVNHSQTAWTLYRDAACANLPTESKRLRCELRLTRSRIDDLTNFY